MVSPTGISAILHPIMQCSLSAENDSHYQSWQRLARVIMTPRMDVHLPMHSLPADTRQRLATCAETIVETATELASFGWTPATSSNFSMRLDAARAAITASGRDKGKLTPADILVLDIDSGQVLDSALKPSAETLLHTQIYRRFSEAGAILHTHSHAQSVASRLFADAGVVRLAGWELQKAITGFDTHESVLTIPVFPNSQHMPDLAAHVDAWLDAGKPLHAYLVSGHGMYAWGRNMAEARRHLEALEFLLNCELDLKRLNS